MRKNFLRTGAAVMAAVMAMVMPMATPITASAAGSATVNRPIYSDFPVEEGSGVAKDGYKYKLPTYFKMTYMDGTYELMELPQLEIVFTNDENGEIESSIDGETGEIVRSYNEKGELNRFLHRKGKQIDCPAGYEIKSVCAILNSGGMISTLPYNISVQNSQDWVAKLGVNINKEIGSWETGDWEYIYINDMFEFSVNYNGTLYRECKAYSAHGGVFGWVLYYVVVPKGFDGSIALTLYSSKPVNGGLVNDESLYWTYYLNGSAATAPQQQPAATTEQQPAVAEPQPVAPTEQQPAATTEQQLAAEQQPAIPTASQSYYTTKPGDNLMSIAQKTYGDKEKWKDIYELNKGAIKNPNIIWANMQLQMP